MRWEWSRKRRPKVADHEENGTREKKEAESAGAKERLIPADWNPIEGIDPRTGKPCQLYVSTRTIKLIGQKRIEGLAKEFGELVPYTVQRRGLKSAFRGVTDRDSEQGEPDWTVYVSKPTYAYDHKRGIKVDPWKGEVFIVFVDGDGLIRWADWYEADPKNPYLPAGHDQGRFLERLI
jgi:hypothetical protein